MTIRSEVCKDCLREWCQKQGQYIDNFKSTRKAGYPGPRCATHWRIESKRRKEANHDRWVVKTYNLAPLDYDRLYKLQGGTCALCTRATGKTKKLAVDHDHRTGHVRGLLCGPCNSILAHARDNPDFFQRCINYLAHPPARSLNG